MAADGIMCKPLPFGIEVAPNTSAFGRVEHGDIGQMHGSLGLSSTHERSIFHDLRYDSMTDFNTALDLYLNGDRQGALHLWRMLAEQGDVRSQFNLGVLYDTGEGVAIDKAQAATYYRAAAEQGFVEAALNLGLMLESGEGLEKDVRQAAHWFWVAAEAGNPQAQFRLALQYDTGEGLPQDAEQAAQWYYRAAEGGEPHAANNLARCFAMGEGLKRSDIDAFKWYAIAAELGLANAARYRERVARELSATERLRAGEAATRWLQAFRKRMK